MGKWKPRRHRKWLRYHVWALAALIVVVSLVLVLLIRSETLIKKASGSVSVQDFQADQSEIRFSLRNWRDLPAECVVEIELGNLSLMRHVGIVEANTSKSIILPMVGLESDNIIPVPHCRWQNTNISGCINTSFELCQLAAAKPSLRQCFAYEWQYQHFCVALLLNDTRYCSDIETEPERTHCYAYVGDKPQLCDGLGASRDWCFEDLAMNWQREDLCRRIAGDATRNTCLAVLSNDLGFCESLADNYACIVRIAERSQNLSLCDFTSDKARCYQELAWMK